jgi:hypothetical protein
MGDQARGQSLGSWSLYEPLRTLLNKEGQWEGTIGRLLKRLKAVNSLPNRTTDWPNSERSLGSQLRRHLSDLRQVGIEVVFEGHKVDGNHVRIIFNPAESRVA